jgi:cellulose synthase/poly-beta-1,6-N-acetylglucosamine synthase-like glycosyltransferase
MLNTLLIIAASVAFGWTMFSLVLAWENRRYGMVRLAKKYGNRKREHRVAVYLPCKGDDGDLAENLEAFFRQQHPVFELHLIVESESDPAWGVIQGVRRRFPHVDSRVVVAGLARREGQKVHNLRVATRDIDPAIRIMVFADADIRPGPQWLRCLATNIVCSRDTVAYTGYRWFLPERNTLVNLVVCSINAAIAGALGTGTHFYVWGGSWAIRRNRFEKLAIRDAWRGTLSDDLVASRTIHAASGLVRYCPQSLCVTRIDLTWYGALEFLRRQYLIARKYAPRLFWPGYLVLASSVLTWWTLLALAILAGGPVAAGCAVAAAVMYFSHVAKARWRQAVFHRKDSRAFAANRLAAQFDTWASPLVSTINLLAMTASLFGSQICWRGNRYHIYRDGQIRLIGGPSSTLPQPSRLPAESRGRAA